MSPSTRLTAALALTAPILAAIGLVAVGVRLAETDVGGDPRPPAAFLSAPAAQVIAPPVEEAANGLIEIVQAAGVSQPGTSPESAPGPQPVPAPVVPAAPVAVPVAPSPSSSVPAAPSGPTGAPAPPDPVSPALPEPAGLVDDLVGTVDGLLGGVVESLLGSGGTGGTTTEEPPSLLSRLLGP